MSADGGHDGRVYPDQARLAEHALNTRHAHLAVKHLHAARGELRAVGAVTPDSPRVDAVRALDAACAAAERLHDIITARGLDSTTGARPPDLLGQSREIRDAFGALEDAVFAAINLPPPHAPK